jgi:tetratricopeptide (TPR) repeat protein
MLAQSSGGAMQSLSQHPLEMRVWNALGSYAMYVGKLLWPSGLAPHYPLRPNGPPAYEVIAGAALLVVITALALIAMKRRKYFVGWLYFVGTLVPVIGLVQVGQQAWADRFAYLPSIGFFAVVAWGGEELITRFVGSSRARSIEASVALAITAACAFFAHRQVATWKDTITVGRHMLEVTTDNNVAHNLLGMGLVDAGEVEEACDHFREALRLAPGDLDALDNYGAALTRLGRYDEAAAQFRQALAMNPTRANLFQHLAQALQAQGKYTEALVYSNEAVRIHPDYWPAHTTRGQLLEQLGKNEEARAAYQRAIAIRPNYIPAWMSLARLLMRVNEYDAAAITLTRAVALDPTNAEIHRGLARAYMARSHAREAAAELELVLRLRPEWPVAEGDLAWLFATSSDASLRDPKRAVELAEHAANASGMRQPTVLDALAAAYAAAGRFAEAARTAETALARAREMNDTELVAKIEKRLAAYRMQRVDRETPR